MAQQTAVEWLVNRWKKLQAKGEKMTWQQVIDITELAKEIEKEQREEAIELPSDEVIEESNPYRLGGGNYNGSAALKWQKGVEWMRDKILNK